jgi:bifunctional oligoribonuclease and PAP phosphatase NrnA
MEKFVQRILKAKRFLLTTHANPDGDGLGSQMALHFYLKKVGKTSVVMNPGPTPAKFKSVDPKNEIVVYQKGKPLPPVDLIFVFDTNDERMISEMIPSLKATGAPLIFVDHHVPEGGNLEEHLIDEQYAATGELVFGLLRALKADIDEEIARALYVAIVTDTGSFRYKRTSPRTHQIAAELLMKGVLPEKVFRDVYSRDSLAKVRLFGHVLDGLQTAKDGRIAWLTIPRATRLKYGATIEDTESFVSSLGYIQGVDIGMLFREEDDGRVKVSLRGAGEIPVVGLAMKFGGGGHRHAAGAKVSLPLSETVRTVCAAAEELLGELDRKA